MIPKVIHYCWFGGKELPSDVKKCMRSWRKKCPEYRIVRWDENNVDVKSHPFMKDAYNSKAWAFVSDYARLKIIYEHGGIYMDTDVELYKSLDDLLKYEAFLSLQQSKTECNTGLGFGAKKHNKLIGDMLKEYDDISFEDNNRYDFRCPILNTNAILKNGFKQENVVQIVNNCILLPPKYMDPVAPGTDCNLLCEDTISIHHYSATWMSDKYQLRRKIINLIGQDKINIMKSVVKRERRNKQNDK